jgi:leucyl aminopeptidase
MVRINLFRNEVSLKMSTIALLDKRFFFSDSKSPTVRLKVYFKHEINSPELADLNRRISGFAAKVMDSVVYPENIDKRELVMFIDFEQLLSKNSLDNESPGGCHISALLGAKVSSILWSSAFIQLEDITHVVLSSEFKSKIADKSTFLVAMEQISVSNKLTEAASSRTVVLESFFVSKDYDDARKISDSMLVTRSLINAPANYLNPASFERFLINLIQDWTPRFKGSVQVETLDVKRLEKDGAGLICAVGRAAKESPRLLKVSWKPSQKTIGYHIALVGKGITYDTGGLDIKPGANMRLMKKDMGGAAAAFGGFLALVLSEYPGELTLWLPLAENAISGDSYRPGDVYKALNGKLVEIDNTDAEGRLILADALVYASREKPHLIIDVATLTGAARVSLGPEVDSAFSNRKEFARLLGEASTATGDWAWPMPRVPQYKSYFESNSIGDMENGGGKFAGAIVGAQFLEHFVDGIPWIHIDSYMWAEKPTLMAKEAGANPKMVRFLKYFIEHLELT